MATLLEYENQIYLDMFNNDALLIMAEGLGIERIFLNFLRLYSDPTHLVMVLNLHEAEEKYFLDKLRHSKQNDADLAIQLPTKITNETHSINERVQAYLKGGCFFVTSRILAVDMLTDRIPIDLISGILVYKAHKVIDTCQETFILRMFRQNNKKGFIKAFSDKPIYFTKNFCQVDRVMKNLFVKALFIYPRFHVNIETELSKHKPEVYEVHVALSENTNNTQMALFDIINVLLQELKGCCSYIDPDFLTMEMVISKPFDKVVRSQLEPVWNQLGSKPKQLISDIKILRLLLYYLIQYDCITFYKMLNCLKMHERDMGRSSGWMFLDAANDLFANARLRICGDPKKGINKGDLNKKYFYTKDNKEMIGRVIKESPKLETLNDILEEILKDFNDEENDQSKLNILLVANDDRTCYQIKHFLNGILKRKFKNSELEFSITTNKNLDALDNENDDDLTDLILKPADLAMTTDHRKPAKASNKRKLDEDDEASEASAEKKPESSSLSKELSSKGSKGRGRGKKDTKQTLLKGPGAKANPPPPPVEEKNKYDFSCKTNLFLNSYDGDAEQRLNLTRVLHEVHPRYVILYDSELWFVRQLEIFKALNFKFSMRVYFLMYKNSYEEQKYLTSIRSEKESFEILIKEKAKIIITNEQDGKSDIEPNKERVTISAQVVQANSRKGGLHTDDTASSSSQPKIIVDMREFRSELPSILHKRGFKIEPVTLEVGDYVLTPNICVERKSINDLIESLSNGRLYNQCTAMTRYYKTPVLLIEFDQKKPFLLNSMQSLATNEINSQHTLSKLVLLTIHFPNLRVLWCSSPNETAEIFEELKANAEQPNAETAQSIRLDQLGLPSETGSKYNPILSELLLKVPGINSKNIKDIMGKVHNLIELCEMDEKELHALIENGKNAKAILEFLNKKKKAANPLYALSFGKSSAAASSVADEEEYISNLNINYEDFENANLK